jgi:type IV fimbrial biogenesis protein FimT
MIMRTHNRGFTIIELMVSLSIAAILLTMAVPAFNSSQLSTQLRSAANNLVASAYFARSEAIKRNAVVRLCVSADGATCSTGNWRQGWIVTAGAEVLHREMPLSNNYRVVAASDNFDFQPTGVDTTPGSFLICRSSPAAEQERVVTIDAVGRAWVQRTATGSCP